MIRLGKQEDGTRGLRLLAFLMAVAMWGFVGVSQDRFKGEAGQRRLTVQVVLQSATGLARPAARVEPAWVDVRLEGPADLLEALADSPPTASVTVPARFRAGDRLPIQLEVPDGISSEVLPDRVTCWPEPSAGLSPARVPGAGHTRPATLPHAPPAGVAATGSL
ncbi:MAG: hypothetical protein VKO64_12185 [Candidatus Sericytochromatia bacterium]|nr:hypothetical protein [Candidatus Sericytochromatia bacterium]